MIQNPYFVSSTSPFNNPNIPPFDLNSEQKPNYINNIKFKSTKPLFGSKNPYIIKKRSYNELMESYKEKFNNLYKKENEELFKAVNLNFQKNINKANTIHENNIKKENIILINDKKDKPEKNKGIKLQKKKFIINDDIDDVEEDFISEKEKKVEKKYKLSKSYLYDEPNFCSDLEDTKENSFSSLNFSFDYPDISFDATLKDKLITNAIELEKTFHRFFNVINMPNKK